MKKTVYSICSVWSVLLVAVVALIIMFSQNNEVYASMLIDNYSATNVDAELTGTYRMSRDVEYTPMSTGRGHSNVINFRKNRSINASFSIGEKLNISPTNYILLRYKLVNTSKVDQIEIDLLNDPNEGNYNLTFEYAYTNVDDANTTYSTEFDTHYLEARNTAYIFVRISITNTANDVDFVGGFQWHLDSN